MMKNECLTCEKKIPGNDNEFKMHLNSKKHIRFLPDQIIVKGNFNEIDVPKLSEYFKKFGQLTFSFFYKNNGSNMVVYKYLNPIAYDKVIEIKNHQVENFKLEIIWKNRVPNHIRKQNSELQTPKKDPHAELKMAVLALLQNAKTLDEEAAILKSKLQSKTAESAKARQFIVCDLEMALAPVFRERSVHIFGSSVTGLNTDSSDLDVYVENAKRLHDNDVNILKQIRTLIFKSRRFSDLLLISGASVPIIKCIHSQTNICLDINVKNKLSVYNSNLIKFYLDFDPKLTAFFLVLKYWMECNDLKKVNCFSGYALYMMIIFYLQQAPYNLPAVLKLQTDVPPKYENNWNCAFKTAEIDRKKYQALANSTIRDLLLGFVKFYSNFDYFHDVICPFLGETVKKIDFIFPYNLPPAFSTYKFLPDIQQMPTKIVCVQDPFEHNRNVAQAVTPPLLGKFAEVCRRTTELLATSSDNILHKMLTLANNSEYAKCQIIMKRNVHFSGKDAWTERVKTNLLKITNDVFKCVTSELLNKNSEDRCELLYECKLQKNIWIERGMAEKVAPKEANETLLDVDCKVTQAIFSKSASLPIKFLLNVVFQSDEVNILLKSLGKCRTLPLFLHYLHVVLPNSMGEETQQLMCVKDELASPTLILNKEKEAQPVLVIEKAPKVEYQPKIEVDVKNIQIKTEAVSDIEISDDESVLYVDEDVPDDFFDDFANDDFIQGLDIDDEHIPVTKPEKIEFDETTEEPKHQTSKSPTKSIKSSKRSTSIEKRHQKPSKSHERSRRDPEKTRQAIEKDKMKEKERKWTTEKLKVGDNEPAPPGTESEYRTVRERAPFRQRTRSRERRYSRSPNVHRFRPVYDSSLRNKRRSLSTDSRPTEQREAWTKKRRRSRTPRRRSDSKTRLSRKRTRSPEKADSAKLKSKLSGMEKKRKTFLEEIREKLNERNTSAAPLAPDPVYSVPFISEPKPVQAPYFLQNVVTPQQYNQSFFIGATPLPVPMPNYMPTNSVAILPETPVLPLPSPEKMLPVEPPMPADKIINQLLMEKKISLHDVLRLCIKPIVISRCETAIGLLDPKAKNAGKLIVSHYVENDTNASIKVTGQYQSPLRRIPIVRFQSTSHVKVAENADNFTLVLNKLLHKIGIKTPIKVLVDKTLPLEKNKTESKPPVTNDMETQTENIPCEECTVRKARVFSEMAVQCVEDVKETVGMEVQVCEEELEPIPVKEEESKETVVMVIDNEEVVVLDDSENATESVDSNKSKKEEQTVRGTPKRTRSSRAKYSPNNHYSRYMRNYQSDNDISYSRGRARGRGRGWSYPSNDHYDWDRYKGAFY